MAKIVGYYDHPYTTGLGAGVADLFNLGQQQASDVLSSAINASWPSIETKINEKLVIAGVAVALGFAGLAALIVVRTQPRA